MMTKIRSQPRKGRMPLPKTRCHQNRSTEFYSAILILSKSLPFSSMGWTISSGPNLFICTSVAEESLDTSLESDPSLTSLTHSMLCRTLKTLWWWRGWWTQWRRISAAIICVIPQPKNCGTVSQKWILTLGISLKFTNSPYKVEKFGREVTTWQDTSTPWSKYGMTLISSILKSGSQLRMPNIISKQ